MISGDFYHGHDKTIDKSKGTEVHSGGFVFPAGGPRALALDRQRAGRDPGHRDRAVRCVQYLNPADDPSKGHS